jgi:hypothetical protein
VAGGMVGAPRADPQPRRMPVAGGAVADRVAAIAAAAARVQQQRPAVAAPAVAKRRKR